MSFTDRFELFDLLREGDVQTFRGRERATGRDVEVHLSASPNAGQLAASVIDRGIHEGKYYVVTMPVVPDAAPLDSAGAWRVSPSVPPPASPTAEPGDFTRMFQLRQAPAPESVPTPTPKPTTPAPSSQPGDFTRAIQRPSAASPAIPDSPKGEAGEFTRMFQTPATSTGVPPPSVPGSNPMPSSKSGEPASPRGFSTGLIVSAILLLCAIAVFVLMRAL